MDNNKLIENEIERDFNLEIKEILKKDDFKH